MSKCVSFNDKPTLIRTISNLYNKEDNKKYSQSDNEYQRNCRMKLLGFLQNTGKETEFDPDTLAREIINDDTNRHEKWWCRVMIYIYIHYLGTMLNMMIYDDTSLHMVWW